MSRSLDAFLDSTVRQYSKKSKPDEVQSPIHPEIYFRYNSVNLVIGKRGSGKTYTTMRELLKLPVLLGRKNPFTQIHYVTDKFNDDTVEKFRPLFEEAGIFFNWVPTGSALKLIQGLSQVKANINQDPIFKECLNYRGSGLPHTLIVFDDCIGLFKKDSPLSKKLFENRQSRITYFLLLQDTQGLSPSMKANIDSLTLFGGFPKHKYQVLMYQLPPVDITYEDYAQLPSDAFLRIDFIGNDTKFFFRGNGNEVNHSKNHGFGPAQPFTGFGPPQTSSRDPSHFPYF